MANTHRAPKQWSLTTTETINSFENWRQNLYYTLSLDPQFAPFLVDGVTWAKKTRLAPRRGFNNDGQGVPEATRRTAAQKVTMLELMLGQIANYCPVIARNTILKKCTSMNAIWQEIRLHYGFQSTGAHLLDFSTLHLGQEERPEDLYQRIVAFVEDNLLRAGSPITHHGEVIDEDEDVCPTLENIIVLIWLQLIHKDLPMLVKQRYGTELRSRTLASIKPEISQAMNSLLDEIHTSQDLKVMRTAASWPHKPKPRHDRSKPRSANQRVCPLCQQAGRPADHFLSTCRFLPANDRKYLTKARHIACTDESDSDTTDDHVEPPPEQPIAMRIQVGQSPYLNVFSSHHVVHLTLDSGATGNMIRLATAQSLGITIKKSVQSARQADGQSPLAVVGEIHTTFVRDNFSFVFEALVVKNLDVDILAGIPFMSMNDVTVRPAKHQVILGDGTIYDYGQSLRQPTQHTVRRAQVIRGPLHRTTVWPGEFIEVDVPQDFSPNDTFALEPRLDNLSAPIEKESHIWPQPDIVSSICGKIRIPNLTKEPQSLPRLSHFCQVRPVSAIPESPMDSSTHLEKPARRHTPTRHTNHSDPVRLDPDDTFPPSMKAKFQSLLLEYDSVFDPNFKGYNGKSGPIKAVINMGPTQPPQRKGRVPQYSRDKLVELQAKFDELEEKAVFVKPECAGITAEYLNPSFLVKKPNGGYRLVTAFADVGRYSKPQPSLMPDVDSTLRHIAQWKYILTTDLTNAFYQIPLSRESMKYCGVATPFKGIRVYARSAMGMPGSETVLEELMCRVLGDMLEEGVVVKLADDLFCGGDTLDELYDNWSRVLEVLYYNQLNLSPGKTVIGPTTVTILGWIWNHGTIKASPHRIATLSTCPVPEKVSGLRSYVGAYKVLARVIPNCSSLLAPLDDAMAGQQSTDRIVWTDDLLSQFRTSQTALLSNRTITLPKPHDQLWVVTDAAVKKPGIGATLYVTRGDLPQLAGFFSAKLRGHQAKWLPCEVEALSIAVATKHFSPYIIQSHHYTCILTDSKPCVQAFEKLCRGEFSASPRVSTFLSVVSRYQASIRHLAGKANIPSDFASRNAADCDNPSCQICSFVARTEDSVVRSTNVQDFITGHSKLPFTSRSAWISIQSECRDLRRTHAHLVQGTRPSKKLTNVKDVKRYLQAACIARDGLLVVRHLDPFTPSRECIIVPREIINGLLTALHIQFDHPSAHQLKQVVSRYFYALDLDKAIDRTSATCHHCTSIKKIPNVVVPQSTGDPPDAIGVTFAADIMRRSRQFILVVRECVTSLTMSCLVEDERHDTLRRYLIQLCNHVRPLDGPYAVIRTDPAPGFVALVHDKFLTEHRLNIEVGRVKNANKNPIAERAVQELENELLRQDPTANFVTPLMLSLATARLNSRIRSRGLSSREMWTQRDQYTNSQLPLTDMDLILQQHSQRLSNHPHSEVSKTPSLKVSPDADIDIGDIVYLHTDGCKSRARDRYLVTGLDHHWCTIKKFAGSQLRKTSYRVKRSECSKAASNIVPTAILPLRTPRDASSDEEDTPETRPHPPPDPPGIPLPLSTPPDDQPATPSLSTDSPDPPDDQPSTDSPDPVSSHDEPPERPHPPSRRPGRSTRSIAHRKPPKRFDDYVMDF